MYISSGLKILYVHENIMKNGRFSSLLKTYGRSKFQGTEQYERNTLIMTYYMYNTDAIDPLSMFGNRTVSLLSFFFG